MTQAEKQAALQTARKKLKGETHTAYLNRMYTAEVLLILSDSLIMRDY